MTQQINRQIVLAARPTGYPALSDFKLLQSDTPKPAEGQVLIRGLWLSLDPYMRGRMREAAGYAPSVEIGQVMVGGTVGEVIESRTPTFAAGDIVQCQLGWQEFGLSDGLGLRKIDPELGPVSTALGVLGMPGMTAYFGLLDVGAPEPGDTVVVSTAAGAVGQIVGQIARIMGCRVVGIAGTQEKVDYIVNDLGFDYGINYKTENVEAAIANVCPDGVDVYFDNVGGHITDAVMQHINTGARISVCGQISQYNLEEPELAPRSMGLLVTNQARMEGFLVTKFAGRFDEARHRMARWVDSGALRYREDVVVGLEKAPDAFIGMMNGENFGKLLVKVSGE